MLRPKICVHAVGESTLLSTTASESPQSCRELFQTKCFLQCFRMHSNRMNSTKLQWKLNGRALFLLFSQCMPPPNNLFLHYVLILSQIDPKCFCRWDKQTEKWELLSQEEKKKKSQQQIFQGTMATEHSKEFWWEQQAERLITRETICYSNCKSNRVWLHIHKHCVGVFIWTTVQNPCSFLSYRGSSPTMNERGGRILVWRWRAQPRLLLQPG